MKPAGHPWLWAALVSAACVLPARAADRPGILFILADDPGERRDLARADPDRARDLRRKLDDYLREVRARLPAPVSTSQPRTEYQP